MHFDCATCVNSGWRQNLWESQKQVFTYLINLMFFCVFTEYLFLSTPWSERDLGEFSTEASLYFTMFTSQPVIDLWPPWDLAGGRVGSTWNWAWERRYRRGRHRPRSSHSGMNERRLWHVSRHVQWIFKSLIRCNWVHDVPAITFKQTSYL